MSFAAILAGGLKGAVIHLIGAVTTEKLFTRTMARLVISILEKIAASTETKIDDEAIKPIVEALKKEV